MLNDRLLRENASRTPIDFEQKPIPANSLNEHDVIVNCSLESHQEYIFLFKVFLLLCAQQNVRLPGGDSTLHPYLFYMPSHLCTQNQKKWWQSALEQT